MEIAQIIQKILIKKLQASQIDNIILIKGQILNVINNLVKTSRNGKSVSRGIFPVKGIENNRFIGVILEISMHHGQLIEVGQQSQLHRTHNKLALLRSSGQRRLMNGQLSCH